MSYAIQSKSVIGLAEIDFAIPAGDEDLKVTFRGVKAVAGCAWHMLLSKDGGLTYYADAQIGASGQVPSGGDGCNASIVATGLSLGELTGYYTADPSSTPENSLQILNTNQQTNNLLQSVALDANGDLTRITNVKFKFFTSTGAAGAIDLATKQ